VKRVFQKEILDLGYYTQEEYEICLEKLNSIGEQLGGDRASLKALGGLKPKSILDVGCGGGFFTTKLAKEFPNAKVIGTDIALDAIDFAKKRQQALPNLAFIHQEVPNIKEIGSSFDVIITTLTAHHMSNQEFVSFLKEAKGIAQTIVVNDLHRHWLAYLLYGMVAPIRYRNRLITHDGLLSIRRSFTKKEIVTLLQEALITNYKIKWHWPFRWTVKIDA